MRSYLCLPSKGPIFIDGEIREKEWGHAAWTEDFVDIMGIDYTKPRFRTRAKMLWDENHLYIAAEMEEPEIWATLVEHDSVIFHDNDFEVFLDPDGDNHNYLELEVNALNTTWDLLLTRPYRAQGSPLTSWETKGLKTGVKVEGSLNVPSENNKGWTMTIAIPWTSLGEISGNKACPPLDGDQWRINFSRVEWHVNQTSIGYEKVKGKPEDNWVWSPQGVVDMHRPNQWGVLQFAHSASEKLEPYPGAAVRDTLTKVYDAQLEFQGKYGHWCLVLSDLGHFPPEISLHTTPTLFEAELEGWHIDSYGRLWID